MELIDSHCHLDFSDFETDRDQIWRECLKAGLTTLIIPGVSPKQWCKGQACAQAKNIHWACGLHPWWLHKIDNLNAALDNLEQTLIHQNPIAVGECGLDGLDKIVAHSSIELQSRILAAQIDLANRYQKPVILHQVKAFAPLLALLKQHPIEYGGVVHGFSGSVEQGKSLINHGLLLGVGGTITYERAKKTRHALSQLPLEKMVLETDAPAMPLSGRQGQPNSPIYLVEIATTLGEIRQQPIEFIAQQTTHNCRKLFSL